MENLGAFATQGSTQVSAKRGSMRGSARGSDRRSFMASLRSSLGWRAGSVENAVALVRQTMVEMNSNLAKITIDWPAMFFGGLMVVATSGQGLFLGVLDERLEDCGAKATETMLLADTLLVIFSGLLLLGCVAWKLVRVEAKGGAADQDRSDAADMPGTTVTANIALLPKCKTFKFMTVGALGTVDNILYLQAMKYHNPAAVMILRLACSLVILTLGQMALRRLNSTTIQVYGLLPLVLSAVSHILAAAAEQPTGASGKAQVSTHAMELLVLVACPFTSAAEVLGTDLLFGKPARQDQASAEAAGAAPEVEPHPALAFGLNSLGAALMDVCIHIVLNEGNFPINSFRCKESMIVILIAALYVFSYKLAMVLCGGMTSIVLRVLNPMLTYVATCLMLQQTPDGMRSVSGLTVLSLVAWYNVAPIWDEHVSLVAQRRTISKAMQGIESNLRRASSHRATKTSRSQAIA